MCEKFVALLLMMGDAIAAYLIQNAIAPHPSQSQSHLYLIHSGDRVSSGKVLVKQLFKGLTPQKKQIYLSCNTEIFRQLIGVFKRRLGFPLKDF